MHAYFVEIYQQRVSAHCLIDRQGQITIQYVNFNDRAWHAGLSCFQGREKCNDFAIGIELEGSDNQPFTEQQYRTLRQLTRLIRQTTRLSPQIALLDTVIFLPDEKLIQANILIGSGIWQREFRV